MILIVRNEVKRMGWGNISMPKMYEYFGGKGIVGGHRLNEINT
jgi:hypothetical protein